MFYEEGDQPDCGPFVDYAILKGHIKCVKESNNWSRVHGVKQLGLHRDLKPSHSFGDVLCNFFLVIRESVCKGIVMEIHGLSGTIINWAKYLAFFSLKTAALWHLVGSLEIAQLDCSELFIDSSDESRAYFPWRFVSNFLEERGSFHVTPFCDFLCRFFGSSYLFSHWIHLIPTVLVVQV